MTELYPAARVLLVMGGVGVLGLGLANVRGAWAWLGLWVLLAMGFAWKQEALAWRVVGESLRFDIGWPVVGLLAVWALFGASAVVRPASFLGVVAASALFGSMGAWVGVALAEPDEGRRARLVLAATGAALLTPWASPASLTLGGASLGVTALGALLALVGFAPGGRNTVAAPRWGEVARAALLLTWLVLLVWLLRQGGVPDFIATGLEALPPRLPGHATLWLGTVATIVGSLLHPAGAALLAGVVLEHATQLRGEWAQEALRVGLTVGAGLPALLLTRARITVGLPLWVLQVLLALAYLAWRHTP